MLFLFLSSAALEEEKGQAAAAGALKVLEILNYY